MSDSTAVSPILQVEDLTVSFLTEDGLVRAVDHVSFSVGAGETVAIVGESGSGKTVTALTIMGLLDQRSAQVAGRVLLGGIDLLEASESELQDVRGRRMAMIFQDPLSALHPYYRVLPQIEEVILLHEDVPKRVATRRAIELLGLVGIPDPGSRGRCYPHEFSGGMRQRAMIAMALACHPELLIADEPTTALDVTVQGQILELMERLRSELNSSMLLITHDLGIVAGAVDTVHVMYAGRIVESGPRDEVFSRPQHPYTRGLFRSVIRLDEPVGERLETIMGQPPSLLRMPSGCAFHPRCPEVFAPCGERVPELQEQGAGHRAACHLMTGAERIR